MDAQGVRGGYGRHSRCVEDIAMDVRGMCGRQVRRIGVEGAVGVEDAASA